MIPADDRGAPAGTAEAKRPDDNVPVRVDWHDYLISRREPGVAVALNSKVRPPRAAATGFQYKCTTAGVTSQKPYDGVRWPTTLAGTIPDGSAVWTAESIDTTSLRLTVSGSAWEADAALTLATQSNSDSIYTTYVAGGTNGQIYEIRHTVTLSNGEIKEALVLLPVKD